MGQVIQFPVRDETTEIDLTTALDVAIRDLRDIAKQCRCDTREQAEACLRMLKVARAKIDLVGLA